jgi:uncharacterized protein (DUF1778 family)
MATTPAPRRSAEAPARTRRPRAERIHLRATSEQVAAIRAAAEAQGVSVTDFVLGNAVSEANRVLADRVHLVWPVEAYEKFLEILDRPARVDPQLRKVLSAPNPWDE